MKRKLSTALVMLLAFVLLLGTTAITASAAETTYQPIGGSTTLVKNLVVDSDANIPSITFAYTIRRGTPEEATATTIEILESPLGGGSIGTAVFSNDDTENTINGLPSDTDRSNPTAGKKYAQKSIAITFPVGTFTKPGVYRFVINETNNSLLPIPMKRAPVTSTPLHSMTLISARRSPVIRVIRIRGSISHLISQALTRVHIPSSQMM